MEGVVKAFSEGGAIGLAMLALLLMNFLLTRTLVLNNRQLTLLFDRMIESNKATAEAEKALAVEIGKLAQRQSGDH